MALTKDPVAPMGANPLKNITIVLVEPKGPLNVGAVARAMKNMGLTSLTLVGGEIDLQSDECRLFAAGSKDVLDDARVVATFEEAIAPSTFVVGTTARSRHRMKTVTARDLSPEILAQADIGQVAVVFGREDYGLFKEELALCHQVVSVPTSEERTSINLAQAVLLLSYEIFQASLHGAVTASTDLGDLIEGEQWDRLYKEVLTCCAETGYMHAGNRLAIEESVKRLLKLGPIQTRDARHLFGLVRRVGKLIDGREQPNPEQQFHPRLDAPRKGDA